MKLACILVGLIALAGCGNGMGTSGGSTTPAGPSPTVGGTLPPPAYIEFGEPGHRMARGSSCWTSNGASACLDAVAPSKDPNLPELIVTRGSTGRIHLGFAPSSAHLTIDGIRVPVQPGRTITFTAHRPGILLLDVREQRGSASYDARIRFARD
jgi:hypothetical protein